MDESKRKVIIPAAVLAAMVLALIVLILGKDTVMGLLTPENDAVRYAICWILAAIGAVILFVTLKHIDSKEK